MAQFIISLEALIDNACTLHDVAERSGARMLVALKAFSTTSALCHIRQFAQGCCASGLYEARLGRSCIGGEIAVYSPAYRPDELSELLDFAHHIDFNSLPQWERYRDIALAHPRVKTGELKLGLRINPCHSTGHTPLYDPCVPGSRLGIPADKLQGADLRGINGLHFHTLCEQGFEDLLSTWKAFEASCGELLASPNMRYLNLGGGHWITKPNYDIEGLITLLRDIRQRYNLDVYLEPGEAWCIHTGILRAQVLDVFESMGYQHAILDVSASAHMPDVLEMPYRPDIYERCLAAEVSEAQPALRLVGEHYRAAGAAGEKEFNYRLGAPTCLAGDVIGDYSFAAPLVVGDELVFDDMSHYTIVKTSHFNGVPHPDILIQYPDGCLQTVKEFCYQDFHDRLG